MLLLRISSATLRFLVASIILHISCLNARDFRDFFSWGNLWGLSPFWVLSVFNFSTLFVKFWKKIQNLIFLWFFTFTCGIKPDFFIFSNLYKTLLKKITFGFPIKIDWIQEKTAPKINDRVKDDYFYILYFIISHLRKSTTYLFRRIKKLSFW